MTASHVHDVAPDTAIAVRNGARLAGTILCLAAVAVLVVVLRLGVYEYFHGEGRVIAWLWNALTS
jgi:hypothetical protein